METLPAWIQWFVAIATVLTSVGVIVAFVQLKESSIQFKQQLKANRDQFTLLNQGYIQMLFYQKLWGKDEHNQMVETEINNTNLYYFSGLVATLENVGNMPIKFYIKHCIAYADGKEIYRGPEEVFKKTVNVIYPKATLPYSFGAFPLVETGLKLQQLSALKIGYKLLIEYHDFHDNRIKTIDREMALSGTDIIITKSDDKI